MNLPDKTNRFSHCLRAVNNIHTDPVVSLGFVGGQSSLRQSPIRIEVFQTGNPSSGPDPFRFEADQKIFGSMPCPRDCFQVSWFSATPKLAHGMGSKDVDDSIKLWVERFSNQA